MNNLKEEIISFIKNAVLEEGRKDYHLEPLVGFSSAADPLFEEIKRIVGPHHLLPREVLPEAETVVSFFIPFTAELVKGNRGRGPVSRDWGQSYIETNALINRINLDLKARLESMGLSAATVPATHNFDTKTLMSGWSHRSAAFVAGLGRFGLNRMLIGPKGGAGRYGTLFTSASVEADPQDQEERCLYNLNGGCKLCLKACPVEALTLEEFDRHKCYAQVLANSELLNLASVADVCGKCVTAGPCALGPKQPA